MVDDIKAEVKRVDMMGRAVSLMQKRRLSQKNRRLALRLLSRR